VLTALIVDDDNLVCWALERALAGQGLSVDVAQTGGEALARLGRARYDIAFLDIHLPDANGLDLLDCIQRECPQTRVVMLSCDDTCENRARAFGSGAWQFVGKPFEMAAIAGLLRSHYGQFPERRRHERYVCHAPLRIELLDPDRDGDADLRYVEAEMSEIGQGGLRLHLDFPLRPGQKLRAWSTSREEPCARFLRRETPAEVVWVRPEHGRFAAGLRFSAD